MATQKQEFIDTLYQKFKDDVDPIGTTQYWHRMMFGGWYDSPNGYQYRKLLMALNTLRQEGKIKAIRTNDATIWYFHYPEYEKRIKEDYNVQQ